MRNLAKDRFPETETKCGRVYQPRYLKAEVNRVYGISKPQSLAHPPRRRIQLRSEDPAADGGETSLNVAYSESETASDSGRLGNTSCEL